MALLREMTWKQAEQVCPNTVAVWGWGAIEQHGPRMTLETDNLITLFFLRLLEGRPNSLVLPLMPYGMSRHHEAFPGTISLSQGTAVGLTIDILRSLYRSGVRKLFVLLGHGGNVRPFKAALEVLGNEMPDLQIVEILDGLFYVKDGELGELLNSFDETVSHAGAAEASILYAMLEKAGRADEIDQLRSVPIDDDSVIHGLHGQGTQGGDPAAFRSMFPTGSKGDQRRANAEVGRKILYHMGVKILAAFDELASR